MFFKSQEVAIYLVISLIKTWETFIDSSICLFLYMAFFLSLPYTPHFVEVCFRIVQTAVFVLPFSLLRFIISWSQTFINAFKLYFILVHNIYIAPENVELVPVLSSVFCYFFCFLENRAWSRASSVGGKLVSNKNSSKTKLVGFWDQSLVLQKAFMLLLIIIFMQKILKVLLGL